MIYISRLYLWLCLAFTVSNCQQLLPLGGYQHDIVFPSITGQFHTSTVSNQQPVRQLSGGFRLNPPPPLSFLQGLPINPLMLPAARNTWRDEGLPNRRFFSPPLFNLFTPNTVRQRPESAAQDEEYRKYLKEEAEETEKHENDVTTDFGILDTDATTAGANSKTFVKLNVQGKNYSYST